MKLSSAVLLLSSSVAASSPASQINNTGDANNDNASQKLRGSSGAPVADGFDDKFHHDFAKELADDNDLLDKFGDAFGDESKRDVDNANPTSEEGTFLRGEYVEFKNKLDTKYCMYLKENKEVFVMDCDDDKIAATSWFMDTLGRFVSPVDASDELCLAPIGGNKYGDLIIEDCSRNDSNQRWTLEGDGRIRNQRHGTFIGVRNGCYGVFSAPLELQNEYKWWWFFGNLWEEWPCSEQQQWIW